MLAINRKLIKWTISTEFLGILLDEDFSWKNHILIVEKKISKNSGAFYKTENIVSKGGLKTRTFSKTLFFFIYNYLNYENISRGSTTQRH